MKKTQREIFEEIQTQLTAINPDWDISPSSIDYQANQALSKLMIDAYDHAERAASSLDIDSADLPQLRNIAYTLGLPLKNQSQSQVTVELTATSDVLLPSGTRFLNAGGNVFVLPQSALLTAAATTTHLLHSLEYGVIGFSTDTYTLETTNDAVTINQVAGSFVFGSNSETEIELRQRIKNTTARNGLNTVDALTSRLYEESLVKEVLVFTNRNAYFVDFDGNQVADNAVDSINPQSTLVFIDFNYPDLNNLQVTDNMKNVVLTAIAESYSVAENLNGGRNSVITADEYTETYTTPTQTINIAGVNRTIGGSSTVVTFYAVRHIDAEIIVNLTGVVSPETEALIKENIMKYTTGGLAHCGLRSEPYKIGESVFSGDFSAPVGISINASINNISSITVNNNAASLTINADAIAIFKSTNITVNGGN